MPLAITREISPRFNECEITHIETIHEFLRKLEPRAVYPFIRFSSVDLPPQTRPLKFTPRRTPALSRWLSRHVERCIEFIEMFVETLPKPLPPARRPPKTKDFQSLRVFGSLAATQ
jgi:hypothetical protein